MKLTRWIVAWRYATIYNNAMWYITNHPSREAARKWRRKTAASGYNTRGPVKFEMEVGK
jgi:hypothetical protein